MLLFALSLKSSLASDVIRVALIQATRSGLPDREAKNMRARQSGYKFHCTSRAACPLNKKSSSRVVCVACFQCGSCVWVRARVLRAPLRIAQNVQTLAGTRKKFVRAAWISLWKETKILKLFARRAGALFLFSPFSLPAKLSDGCCEDAEPAYAYVNFYFYCARHSLFLARERKEQLGAPATIVLCCCEMKWRECQPPRKRRKQHQQLLNSSRIRQKWYCGGQADSLVCLCLETRWQEFFTRSSHSQCSCLASLCCQLRILLPKRASPSKETKNKDGPPGFKP
jgi:hypothetical protein